MSRDPVSLVTDGRQCLLEVKTETWVSAIFTGTRSKLPESDLVIYSSYTFRHSKTLRKGCHVAINTTEL